MTSVLDEQGPGRGMRDRGSASVEAVVLVPALMFLILIVIQLGLWAHAAQVVRLAASEGDRIARSQGGGTAAGIAQAESAASSEGLSSPQVAAQMNTGDVVRISVSGTAVSILPGLSLPVSSAQSGPVQEFRQSG